MGSLPESIARLKPDGPGWRKQLTILILTKDKGHHSVFVKLNQMFVILFADNIGDGVAIARGHSPALIIANQMEDCKDLKSELKKRFQTSRIPVLAIISSSDISRAPGDLTWDDFIQTPFGPDEMLLRVKTMLHRKISLHYRYVDFQPEPSVAESPQETLLRKVKQAVEENLNNPLFGVADLARALGVSQPQLYRKLVAIAGISPNGYIRHVRLKHAACLLSAGAGNVGEIAFRVGFSSHSYFTKCFKAVHRLAPKKLPVGTAG